MLNPFLLNNSTSWEDNGAKKVSKIFRQKKYIITSPEFEFTDFNVAVKDLRFYVTGIPTLND